MIVLLLHDGPDDHSDKMFQLGISVARYNDWYHLNIPYDPTRPQYGEELFRLANNTPQHHTMYKAILLQVRLEGISHLKSLRKAFSCSCYIPYQDTPIEIGARTKMLEALRTVEDFRHIDVGTYSDDVEPMLWLLVIGLDIITA